MNNLYQPPYYIFSFFTVLKMNEGKFTPSPKSLLFEQI